MEAGYNHVAQVFVWKQGSAPDLAYARRVLSAVNPEAYAVASGANPPLQLFSILGGWPDEPWDRAMEDMLSMPAPNGTRWTDTSRYELAGWQGTDSRTGDKLFVVTVYSRVGPPPGERFVGGGVRPPPNAPETPYYPQYPAGPQPQPGATYNYSYPQYQGMPGGGIYGQPYAYPYGYNPMPVITGAFPIAPIPGEAPQAVVPQDYAQFYASFGERLAAALIDAFFMGLLQAPIIAGLLWVESNTTSSGPHDFGSWLGSYAPFICLGLLIFVGYHVIAWSLYGRSWGKALMGIRIVRSDGTPPEFGHALLRMLGYFISLASLGWGFLLMALDSRRQGLHDKIAETYVVPDKPAAPVPLGLQGYRATQQSAATGAGVGYMLTPPIGPTPGDQSARTRRTAIGSIGPAQHQVEISEQQDPARWTVAEDEQEVQPQVSGQEVGAERAEQSEPYITPALPSGPLGPVRGALPAREERERPERASDAERARLLFREGIAELEGGVRKGRDRGLMDVEPGAARLAAERLRKALELVPGAVAYRYFYAVALRYSEGFEAATGEFNRVLELDPGHFEAKQQIAFGPRWHDAFAYPAWGNGNHIAEGTHPPEDVSDLLAQPRQSGTRLILVRSGSNKVVAALSRTPRDSWAKLPTLDMPARIELVLSRTTSGPIIAFYLIVQDDPDNPFKGETFLNPHDPGLPSDDACQLGQHMVEQLAQQDHTYLIFVDENDRLLMSRKLVFGAAAQVNIARILFEVQGLPVQVMDPGRFQQAAQWHMEHFPLEQVK